MLHKASKLIGFHLLATDGPIGHVDDVLVDTDWTVKYLVADMSNWPGGKSVLIAPSAIEAVDSPNKTIRVNLTRAAVTNCPSIDTADIELIETLPPVNI